MSTSPSPGTLSRTSIALAVGVLLLLLLAPASTGSALTTDPQEAAASPTTSGPEWGVYAGPGPKGVTGAHAFASTTGTTVSRVLDFLPDESWDAMTRVRWLTDAYRGSGFHLELSVPMIPRSGGATLELCAAKRYDQHWTSIAATLQSAGLGRSTVRPGWEANGSWYPWSARGHETAYVGCFRSMVTAMRRVAPGLAFSWSVNNGDNVLAGDKIWPGAGFVDVVSVDAYDQDWYWYPVRAGSTLRQARDKAWQHTLTGPHGLAYWSTFAHKQGKPLALSEWGLSWRADGHGGLDDVAFVDRVVTFVRDPTNRVAYATYFNNVDTPRLARNVTRTDTRFPQAARQLASLTRS